MALTYNSYHRYLRVKEPKPDIFPENFRLTPYLRNPKSKKISPRVCREKGLHLRVGWLY